MKYYNNCLFFNVQKDFIIQSGDPTGTGKGGDSVFKCVAWQAVARLCRLGRPAGSARRGRSARWRCMHGVVARRHGVGPLLPW